MRIGSFELAEPLPRLKQPHALAVVRPWIDAGSTGTLTLHKLEEELGARELARLTRPGNFIDFTRYRPVIYYRGARREVMVPNSIVSYALREEGHDLVLLHLLEPHMMGELYASSVLLLLQRLGVQRYCLMGSMYDVVPHTRPMLVTGATSGKQALADATRAGIQTSDYEGPTTIMHLVAQNAQQLGIETMTCVAHLPQYTQLEEDYMGVVRLLEVLSVIYRIPVDRVAHQKAEQQLRELDAAVAQNPEVKAVVTQLEAHYDARIAAQKEAEEKPQLSPEIEKFLREMEKRFHQG